MSFRFSIITALSGKVQKRIIKDKNYMPIKDPNWSLGISKGYVDEVEINTLQEFSECLQGLKPNQAITLGVTDLIGRQSLTTKENLENDITYRENYIARSKDYFHWGAELFLLLLDHDPEPEKLSLGSEEFWEVLCIVFPALPA